MLSRMRIMCEALTLSLFVLHVFPRLWFLLCLQQDPSLTIATIDGLPLYSNSFSISHVHSSLLCTSPDCSAPRRKLQDVFKALCAALRGGKAREFLAYGFKDAMIAPSPKTPTVGPSTPDSASSSGKFSLDKKVSRRALMDYWLALVSF